MLLDIHDILMLDIFHSINIIGYCCVQKSTVYEDSAFYFNKDKDMNKYKLYGGIVIIVLLSIVGFIINNHNKSIYYNDSCDNAIMLESDNDSSRPVKGMKYKDSIDSLAFSKHVDLSNIDGDNFYSREITEDLTNGKVYK